jgi:glycosyltransferase involved in cell wall biosynthesis
LNKDELKFKYRILKSWGIKLFKSEGLVFTFPGLIRQIINNKPDKIIVSGFSVATVKLFLLSFIIRYEYYIWSGAVLRKGRFDSKIEIIKRKILSKKAAGFIVYGTKAKEYLLSLGIQPHKIHISYNTVDTSFFSSETRKLRKNSNEKFTLCYIGYLSPRKNVARLIELVKQFSHINYKLLIIGDGEERPALEDLTTRYSLQDKVIFTGFKQKKDLPAYLAQTDLFLFQTDFDIWGLVLNEAMAAGCCCLASINAGATHDLIENGMTGFSVDFAHQKTCADLIQNLFHRKEDMHRIGRKAEQYILNNASLALGADKFIQAIES